MAAEMDWSTVPAELLGEIVKKLDSVVKFVRFRAVCRRWCSTASPADLPPQLPWLLLPFYAEIEYRLFLCLSTGLVRVLRLPETQDKRICGSGHGWLILFDDETTAITLINPLTGSTISLPPTGIPGRRLVSAVLSANPTSPSGCIVALSAVTSPTITFCWLWPGGSSDWRKIQMRVGYWVISIAYHRGKLCVTDCQDSLLIWETTPQMMRTQADFSPELPSLGEGGTLEPISADFSLELPSLGEDWTLEHCQIVDSSEELLLVAVYQHSTDKRNYSAVYRFDSENQQINRVVSESIGDGVHLLHNNLLVPVSTGVYVACKESLYFGRCRVNDGNVNATIKVLDLKNGGIKELQYGSCYLPGVVWEAAWLVPSLI